MAYAKCKVCGQELATREEAHEHLETMHPNPQNYRCYYCGEYFGKHVDFEAHADNEHPGWRDKTAKITKEYTTIEHGHVYQQRGNPSTPQIPIDFEVIRSPTAKPGWSYFNGKWYQGEYLGWQWCNRCGKPLLKYPEQTDDPEYREVYVPAGFKLNEVHFYDVSSGRKYAENSQDALHGRWTVK